MADQNNYYFRAAEMRALLDSNQNVSQIVITGETKFSSTIPNVGILVVSAKFFDAQGTQIPNLLLPGCPHPCNSTPGGQQCSERAEAALNQYLGLNLF